MNKLLLRTKDGIKEVEGDFNEKDLKIINNINCSFDVEFDKDDFERGDLISINNDCISKKFVPPEVDQDLLEEMRNKGLI